MREMWVRRVVGILYSILMNKKYLNMVEYPALPSSVVYGSKLTARIPALKDGVLRLSFT